MSVHAVASPEEREVGAGEGATFELTVTNTSELIDGYSVDVFGVDRDWFRVEPERLPLFPGDSGKLAVTVVLPDGYPAMKRTLAFSVRSENDPDAFALSSVQLSVLPERDLSITLDPPLSEGGRQATFSLLIHNAGNAPLDARPHAVDPENSTKFDFNSEYGDEPDGQSAPRLVRVPAGQTSIVTVTAAGGRAWFGPPKPRTFLFGIDGFDSIEGRGVFLQRPRIPRWVLSLLGLLTAAAVFGAVLFFAFQDLAENAAGVGADVVENAFEDADLGGRTVPIAPATVSGTLALPTGTSGLAGIQAQLFTEDNPALAVASAVTQDDGSFEIGGVKEGDYLLRFSGAGFDPIWYPGSATASGASLVTAVRTVDGRADLQASTAGGLQPMTIAGRPGTVKGVVADGNPVGAIARLVVESELDVGFEALVASISVAADGSFDFQRVPAPNTYTLIVEQQGYKTERREVRLEAAETLDDIEVLLRPAEGLITGLISTKTEPLGRGGVTITATDGSDITSTVSFTVDGESAKQGQYVLRNLSVPGRYAVTVQADGLASETRSVVLTDESPEQIELDFTLTPSVGSIRGVASLNGVGPAGGVVVSVAGAGFEVVTTSVSASGSFAIDAVPVPGVYTVSFSHPGYLAQVQLVELDARLDRIDVVGLDGTLTSATGVIGGTVLQSGTAIAGALVTITDGLTTYSVTSAHDPLGSYEVSSLPPGSYTVRAELVGAEDAVRLISVLAAERRLAGTDEGVDLRLGIQATVTGRVVDVEGMPVLGALVRLIPIDQFPTPPSGQTLADCTDESGEFSFTPLEGGAIYVAAVYQLPITPIAEELDSLQVTAGTGIVVPTFRDLEIDVGTVECF